MVQWGGDCSPPRQDQAAGNCIVAMASTAMPSTSMRSSARKASSSVVKNTYLLISTRGEPRSPRYQKDRSPKNAGKLLGWAFRL